MDFKKCSEVYGYKSIAEVEEEESNNRICDFAQALIDAGKITVEEAVRFSNLSRDRFKEKV